MTMTFRKTPMRRGLALSITAVSLAALAACGGGGKNSASTTEAPTTTEASTTTGAPVTVATSTTASTTTSTTTATTTTVKPRPTYPLTGLPASDFRIYNRPAIAVKFDNHHDARPHAGINQADIVYEEIVEAEITRFFAIFQSTGAAPFGPIRSARTTDVNLLNQLNKPLFVWSGGNANVVRAISHANADSRAYGQAPGFYRDQARHRRAAIEHTLMNTSTDNIWRTATLDEKAPPQLLQYRPFGAPATEGAPAASIDVNMRSVPIHWQWDPAKQLYIRSEYGAPHMDASGQPVSTNNVIFQFVPYSQSPADARSPEAETVGKGNAIIFTGGKVILGQWTRPQPSKPAVFTDVNGKPILVARGRSWIELPQAGVTQVHFH
jgi:hypothetical protein